MSSADGIACQNAESDDCLTCQNEAIYHCGTQHGCADEYGAYTCCLSATCPSDDPACAERANTGACRAQSDALIDCAVNRVADGTCPVLDSECIGDARGAGGTSSAGDCVGTATTSGQASGAPLPARYSYAQEDEGGIGIMLTNTPMESVPSGERALLLHLQPIENQLSYPSTSGLARCGVIVRTASGWAAVSELICDMTLSTLQYASAPDTCDGNISGGIIALPGATTFTATFDVPLAVARTQITGPSCLPVDTLCSSDDACCSKSCSLALGRCN